MALSINLSGKTVLITGVTSGIGAGIAQVFAQAGANVAGCGRSSIDSEAAIKFMESVKKYGRQVFYVSVDVTSPDDLKILVDEVINRFGKLDTLISNAGVNIFEGLEECTTERWEYNMQLNLTSHWQLARYCKPYLVESKGTILIMTSNHAYYSLPGCFPYNVTKTALTGLVRSITLEWSPDVRCIGLAPGFIYTEGCEKWFESLGDTVHVREKVEALHPVKKIGSVEEVGVWCVFLTSELASFAAGHTYLLDGGRSAVMQDF